jgi:Integrase core domain
LHKICRKNGITHRLTQPASPNQNGKFERLHGTLRPDFLDHAELFESVEAAQAAVDAWVACYNTDRPHQGLDVKVPVVPADRFVAAEPAEGAKLRLPATLEVLDTPGTAQVVTELVTAPVSVPAVAVSAAVGERVRGSGRAIELDRVVPASGNMSLCGNQFWLGPARAGQLVRFWIDCEWVHLSIGGHRVKTLRSRFAVNDLDTLVAQGGAVPAGPRPLASKPGPGSRANRTIVEVERTVARAGTVSLGGRVVLAAWMLAGRRVGIYIEEGAPCCSSTPRPESCSAPGPTRFNPARPRNCSVPARSGRCHARRPSRSGFSGGRRTPA